MPTDTFTVGLIGHTGRGNYGHYLDAAFVGVDGTRIVAVADPDAPGRARVQQLTGASKAYADYRDMLDQEQPDIAVLASREIGDHLDLVLETAARGAHIYLEKPCAATPAQVDRMMAACQERDLLFIIAHPWRGHPPIQKTAIPLIRSGKIGQPRLARVFCMGGAHGGNQLFLDLIPHFFDFLWQVWGTPQWCQAHFTQDGRTATPADLKPGVEGMGLVAGDGLRAYYHFADGFAADFESYRGDGKEIPYRIDLHGTEGTLSLPGPMSNQPDIYFHPLTNPPVLGDDRWEAIPTDPPPDDHKWLNAHRRMAASMVQMLRGEDPEWDLVQAPNARLYLEWGMAAHAAHMLGQRVPLPLPPPFDNGENPFDTWKET